MSDAVLEVAGIGKTFGGLRAVQDISFSVSAHERIAVIGPNGAGKSTLINLIAGYITPSAGQVRFLGRDLKRIPAHIRARKGMARTFQNLELFPTMSVLDNVLSGLETRFPGSRRQASLKGKAMDTLALFDLDSLAEQPTGTLPYGVRKLVELSRVLVADPPLLLLDEPVAGLDDAEEFVGRLIQVLSDRPCSVVLIEHDMQTVETVAETVYVMDAGKLIASGPYKQVSRDPLVIEAYLGKKAAADLE